MEIHTKAPDEMKKAGRPPLPKSVKKSHHLPIRFTTSDFKKLEDLSRRMKSSKGEVIRTLLAQA